MKTAILFPGQGVQYPGMLRELLTKYPCTMEVFWLAQDIYGQDLYSFINHATQEELNETKNTQLSLLACELAVLRILRESSLPYEASLGFSLGEWAALVAAGAADEQSVLETIGKRATAMQRAVPSGGGAMAAILGQEVEVVEQLCNEIGNVFLTNYNCPGNITIAGTREAVNCLLQRAEEKEIMTVRLSVSIPSHCPLMDPAVQELSPRIQALPLQEPCIPLLMNATGRPAAKADEIKENLIRQLSQPVLFMYAVEYLLNEGYDTFIEAGPGKTLCGMVKQIAKQRDKKVRVMPLNDLETWNTIRRLFGI